LQQLKNKYSIAQVEKILPQINAFKQYYVCKQELVYLVQKLRRGCDVASETAQHSAIFVIHQVDEIVDRGKDLWMV